jgi:uncharacterized C2H2 Zn-finger protein
MVVKTCPVCEKIFSTTANYNNHLNRKNPCIPPNLLNMVLNIGLKHQCNLCEKRFQTRQQLTNHLNRKYPCQIKNPHPNEIELQTLFEKLKKENEELKTQLNQTTIQTNTQNTQNNQINNNMNNSNVNSNSNNTNNITINVYGQEDMSHITDAMYKTCFRQVKRSVEKLFKMKHFSPQMQENHNLYISNMRDAYMMIFRSGKWNIANKASTLEKMYYDTKDNLSSAFDKLRDEGKLDADLEKLFSWFVDEEIDEIEENKLKKISTNEMAYMAYNNRKFPMEIKKKMETNLV